MRLEDATPSVKKKSEPKSRQLTVWTVGHSTRPVEEFIELLRAHEIEQLVDVRTIPRSRHNPQYGQDQLGPALEASGIHYLHMPGLGGLRHTRRDSINTAWRNASFRGYADYMQTEAFADALHELIGLARERRTAIMCAEAVPWRCHRSLVADALVVRGIAAEEIASSTRTQPHKLTPWAHVEGETVTYPGTDAGLDAGEDSPAADNKPTPARRRVSKNG